MLTPGGEVKVMDFGIAATWEIHSTTGQQLLATASYVAPERVAGGRASPAGDIYSLGVVLYELLTGRLPFVAGTAEQLLRAHLEASPRPVRARSPWVPPEIAAACEAALAKHPTERPATAGAFAARLRAAAEAAADVLASDRVGADRPEPTWALSADQTEVVDAPDKVRRFPTIKAAAAVVMLFGTAGAALALWQTTNVDRRPSGHPPSAATVRQAPPARAASVTVTLRYGAKVWTRCTVDGRLAFDGVLTPGQQRSWTARRSVELVLGNPTGVELAVDGKVLGRPNGHGHLWRGTFRPNHPPPPLD
jgi:serine/threonine-protein kinase